MKRLFILLFILIFLSGCNITEYLVDKRAGVGCYVAGGRYDSMFVPADVARTSVWCSEDLPDNFTFSFDDGRAKVKIGGDGGAKVKIGGDGGAKVKVDDNE